MPVLATVTEGDTTGNYTLTLTETPATDVTVTLSYSGTAADGTDYTGVTTVTIPAGFDVADVHDRRRWRICWLRATRRS